MQPLTQPYVQSYPNIGGFPYFANVVLHRLPVGDQFGKKTHDDMLYWKRDIRMKQYPVKVYVMVLGALIVLAAIIAHLSSSRGSLALEPEYNVLENFDAQGRRQGAALWQARNADGEVIDTLSLRFRDGIKDGPLRQYFIDGTLLSSGTYVNNLLDGPIRVWYDNGQMRYEAHFKSGLLDGESKHWSDEGKLRRVENWLNGERDGISTWYYKSGAKQREAIYEGGKLAGPIDEWDEEGNLKE